MPIENHPPNKAVWGLLSGFSGTLLATPGAKLVFEVISDRAMSTPFRNHFLRNYYQTIFNPRAAFLGGVARLSQRSIVPLMVFATPNKALLQHPIATTVSIGLLFSPITGFFEFLQVNKVAGCKYSDSLRYFFSKEGFCRYKKSISSYAPGEVLRASTLFGASQYVKTKLRGTATTLPQKTILLNSFFASSIAASLAAFMALPLEVSAITSANIHKKSLKPRPLFSFFTGDVSYFFLRRCVISLFIRNFSYITPITWLDESMRHSGLPHP